MNPIAQLLVSVAAAVAVAFAVVHFSASSNPPLGTDSTAPSDGHTALADRLDAVERSLTQIREQLQSVAIPPSRTAVPEIDPAVIEAAIRQFVADSEDPDAIARLADAVGARGARATPFDLASSLATLRNASVSWEDKQAIWSSLTEEESDRLLAEFERYAEGSPGSADAQNELGEAYVHRLMNEDFLGMMTFGQKAEKQFDVALALDDHHWSARFNKAMSLSNQPAFLGKQPEAIQHFETLMQQQEAAPPEGKHAQTYLFLGNLNAQAGNHDKAKEVWERGLSRFPQAAELRAKLGK